MRLLERNPELKGTKDWNTTFPNEVSLNVVKFTIQTEKGCEPFIDALRKMGDFEYHWDKKHPGEWIRYASMWAFPLTKEYLMQMLSIQKDIVGLIIPERRYMLLLVYTEDGKEYDRVPFKFSEEIPMDEIINEFKSNGICL